MGALSTAVRINCLSTEQLGPILERKRKQHFPRDIPKIPLDTLLISILEKANAFVPSLAGSILIDDPFQKMEGADTRDLVFVCCFGSSSENLVGERIPVGSGIVGSVYRSGASMITNQAYRCPDFTDQYDRKLGYNSQTILCVPVRIEQSVCGVIELLNKVGGGEYLDSERDLLEIFAGYISLTIQNAVDAKKIEKMVRMDDLTGLANDRCLHERLPQEVERSLSAGEPLSVIFLDLDFFKTINDTYGHLAGSHTLAEFGHLLAKVIIVPDATLSRYGGDEFVILLPRTPMAAALAVAESIRSATDGYVFLSHPWGQEGQNEPPLDLAEIVTTSIGVSTLQPAPVFRAMRHSDVVVKLLQCADSAMYAAKETGKNKVVFHPLIP